MVEALFSFRLSTEIFLIPLAPIERIVQMVALRPIPGAPADLPGLLTVRAIAVPVLDVRTRLGLPFGPPSVTEHLILLRIGRRRAALLVEEALELVMPEQLQVTVDVIPASFTGALPWIGGTVLYNGASRLVFDIEALLSFVPTLSAPTFIELKAS